MSQSTASPPLIDLLDEPPAGPPEGSARGGASKDRADRLIEYALAEYEGIARLDESLGRLALRYADRRGCEAVRRMYQHWAGQADELLRRVRAGGSNRQPPVGTEKLEYAVGRTLAMLSISPEALELADKQIRKGELVSVEEVRRELRARSPA